jgi:hypothetical protein
MLSNATDIVPVIGDSQVTYLSVGPRFLAHIIAKTPFGVSRLSDSITDLIA